MFRHIIFQDDDRWLDFSNFWLFFSGWLNTYESYFSTWSKSTLDTVLNQLTRDKEMKFVWAEVVFLEKWYTELQPMNKKAFKKLVFW